MTRQSATGGAFHSQDGASAALWLPPGLHPDEENLIKLFEQTLSGPVLDEMYANFEQMGRVHPEEPCWHLAFIGVDPAHRGKGLGSALLKHTLGQCGNAAMGQCGNAAMGQCGNGPMRQWANAAMRQCGKLAYLESTNAANLSLYRRYGFEVIGEIQAGNCPVMYPMIRAAGTG